MFAISPALAWSLVFALTCAAWWALIGHPSVARHHRIRLSKELGEHFHRCRERYGVGSAIDALSYTCLCRPDEIIAFLDGWQKMEHVESIRRKAMDSGAE